MTRTLNLLLLTGSMAHASSLSVYQDQANYNYAAKSSFIGLTKGVKAKCDGNTVGVHVIPSCPNDKRLCKELISLKKTEQKLNSIKSNSKVLEQLISLPQPTSFDANAWIKSAKLVGEEQAKLFDETNKATEELKLKQVAFHKQAPSKQTLISNEICTNEMEFTLPYGYVSFSTAYEADMQNEKEIKVTQYLSIVNRSGIDIKADKAMFYYRSANQYIRPVHFDPWTVSKYEPRPERRVSKRVMMQKMEINAMAMSDEASIAASPAPVASYIDAREYQIDNLNLPSSGLPVDVQVTSWSSPLTCKIKAYPYFNIRAFSVCSFEPKYQIDSNRWKIKTGKITINEKAVGEYRDGIYNLYTKIEEDIKIMRKPIVKKDRETGIFGDTVRKKDGFVLTLTNKSDKSKTLTLVDRIPASTTDEIEVKLLEIRSDKKVNYQMLKDGQVEMKIVLSGQETKKIEVLFEISYDKDLKISY
ncbi:MAG: DUF4139 domain-containing protein [Sulfurovum sp.]|nr:DUF4139 domain-containing protein [Sulfurovum sp.]